MTDLPATTEDTRLSFGQSSIRAQDLIPPRVKIVQLMSQENRDKLAEPGDFYNVLTGETYGPSLRVQPITTFMQRIFLVRQEKRKEYERTLKSAGLPPLAEGEGLMCRSFDTFHGIGSPGIECNDCPLSKWDGNTPPPCTETYNVAASTEIGDLVLLSFSKSGAKVGKRLNSVIRMQTRAPWLRFLDFETIEQRNDKGTFFVPGFRVSSEPVPMELVTQAARWGSRLQGVVMDVTPTPEDEPMDEAEIGSTDDQPF